MLRDNYRNCLILSLHLLCEAARARLMEAKQQFKNTLLFPGDL